MAEHFDVLLTMSSGDVRTLPLEPMGIRLLARAFQDPQRGIYTYTDPMHRIQHINLALVQAMSYDGRVAQL